MYDAITYDEFAAEHDGSPAVNESADCEGTMYEYESGLAAYVNNACEWSYFRIA